MAPLNKFEDVEEDIIFCKKIICRFKKNKTISKKSFLKLADSIDNIFLQSDKISKISKNVFDIERLEKFSENSKQFSLDFIDIEDQMIEKDQIYLNELLNITNDIIATNMSFIKLDLEEIEKRIFYFSNKLLFLEEQTYFQGNIFQRSLKFAFNELDELHFRTIFPIIEELDFSNPGSFFHNLQNCFKNFKFDQNFSKFQKNEINENLEKDLFLNEKVLIKDKIKAIKMFCEKLKNFKNCAKIVMYKDVDEIKKVILKFDQNIEKFIVKTIWQRGKIISFENLKKSLFNDDKEARRILAVAIMDYIAKCIKS